MVLIFFQEVSNLHELWYFDASCNRISKIDQDIQYCSKLKDLHLSFNNLKVNNYKYIYFGIYCY